MTNNPTLTERDLQVLETARRTFGDTTQILVAMEELCELACVCAKYPRYDKRSNARDDLHTKAIDEIADVTVVLNHVINIMDIDPAEVEKRIHAKIDRLHRWVVKSNSMQVTVEDRKVEENPE